MQRDPISATALITGSLGIVAVALLHPTGHDLLTSPDGARSGVLVHALALTALPTLFFGLLGLSRHLGSTHAATAALVAYGFGVAATLCAAVASGFVATAVFDRMRGADGADLYHALAWYTYLWNQGFATVDGAASSIAIVLWSAVMVRTPGAMRAIGIVGVVIGAGLLLGQLSGHLRFDVHGFMVATLAQSVWMIGAGVLMWRGRRSPGFTDG